jgi:hypothetical protein
VVVVVVEEETPKHLLLQE